MPHIYNTNTNTLRTTEINKKEVLVQSKESTSCRASVVVEAVRDDNEESRISPEAKQINEKPQTSGVRLAEVVRDVEEELEKNRAQFNDSTKAYIES